VLDALSVLLLCDGLCLSPEDEEVRDALVGATGAAGLEHLPEWPEQARVLAWPFLPWWASLTSIDTAAAAEAVGQRLVKPLLTSLARRLDSGQEQIRELLLEDVHCGPEAPPYFDWASSRFADWKVWLDDKTYHLHRVILAEGPRRCDFFAAAFNSAYESTGTDLTHLLPSQCHPAFETALDFIYGHNSILNEENVCVLMKIGEVLQCGALVREAVKSMQHLFTDGLAEDWLREAQELQLKSVVAGCLERMINLKGAKNLQFLEHWASVDMEICVDILSKDDLQVEEDDVADFVLRVVPKVGVDTALQKALWGCVRFAGVSDAVLQKVSPCPGNFEAMACGLRAKCLGDAPHLRGSYWTKVKGRGHLGDDGRVVEFQGAGTAQSHRHRCTVQLLKCENGAGSAVGFATKDSGENSIPCSEGGFATRSGSYAISVFSNGLGFVWKNGQRLAWPVLNHVREGKAVCATFDKGRGIVMFEVVGHEDEAIHVNVEDSDLADSFVFTVSSCTCGARYKLV
ncbi:unnamed protein product, partial [Effrenium voratum]